VCFARSRWARESIGHHRPVDVVTLLHIPVVGRKFSAAQAESDIAAQVDAAGYAIDHAEATDENKWTRHSESKWEVGLNR
jgi:hypothetical protein